MCSGECQLPNCLLNLRVSLSYVRPRPSVPDCDLFEDIGKALFAAGLPETLENLDLSGNPIEAHLGVFAFALARDIPQHLKRLSLVGNLVG